MQRLKRWRALVNAGLQHTGGPTNPGTGPLMTPTDPCLSDARLAKIRPRGFDDLLPKHTRAHAHGDVCGHVCGRASRLHPSRQSRAYRMYVYDGAAY